jgi:hypothetical protein
MKVEQRKWTSDQGWEHNTVSMLEDANLVFVFGERNMISNHGRFNEIRNFYPKAEIVCGSTSGEIFDTQVLDDIISLVAVSFEHTPIRSAKFSISEFRNSYEAGNTLAKALNTDDLSYVFVLSDGLKVNGSELVRGINETLNYKVRVTGGLAGDAARFEKTLVGLNSAPEEGSIIGIGFYGDRIKIGHGSKGGWDPFGPERKVTRSRENVLHELDGQSALQLYKTYLGEKAEGLPGTGLLFPLSLKLKKDDTPIVRTLLGVNEEEQSMTFAGDIPEGSVVQLMKANFDKLIDASSQAAEKASQKVTGEADLAILISCVGRKLILGQRIEEEVEEVRNILGNKPKISGFYSYGEISPVLPEVSCNLLNQTMTITTFSEI